MIHPIPNLTLFDFESSAILSFNLTTLQMTNLAERIS